jgi:signal recognition particle subunit SRP54
VFAQWRVSLWGVLHLFEALSGKLSGVFDGLAKRGALSEADVMEAMREVRLACWMRTSRCPLLRTL